MEQKMMKGIASRRNEHMMLTFITKDDEMWFARAEGFLESYINEGDSVIGYITENASTVNIVQIDNPDVCILPNNKEYVFV